MQLVHFPVRLVQRLRRELGAVASVSVFFTAGGCADVDMTDPDIATAGEALVEPRVDVELYNGNREGLVDRLEGAVGLRWSVNGSRDNCGTGTLISPDLFITVHQDHCNYAPGYTVAFNYQKKPNGDLRAIEEFEILERVDPGQRGNGGIDYSVVRLAGKPGLKYGYVRPGMYKPPPGQPAIMIHHAGADPKMVSIGEVVPDVDFEKRLTYDIDSSPGASGSGVLDKDGRLVAVNNASRGGFHQGVSMKTILDVSPIADEILRYAAPCSGRTTIGATNWVDYGANGVYVDINTSKCGFSSTPRYFTSLGGATSHWLSKGATSIYAADKDSFRVYVQYDWGMTPSKANGWEWHINWEAYPTDLQASTLCTGRSSKFDWQQSGADKIYVDVDTSKCGFSSVPQYFTALEGTSRHWTTTGATAIHNVRADKFRVYLNQAGITPAEAEAFDWRITWRAEMRQSASMGTTADACVGTADDWRQYGTEDLYMDVDTSGCLLAPAGRDPLAFFTIRGSNHSILDGLTSVYSPSANKFRVFVSKTSAITPTSAANNGWKVNWHLRD